MSATAETTPEIETVDDLVEVIEARMLESNVSADQLTRIAEGLSGYGRMESWTSLPEKYLGYLYEIPWEKIRALAFAEGPEARDLLAELQDGFDQNDRRLIATYRNLKWRPASEEAGAKFFGSLKEMLRGAEASESLNVEIRVRDGNGQVHVFAECASEFTPPRDIWLMAWQSTFRHAPPATWREIPAAHRLALIMSHPPLAKVMGLAD